MKNIGTRRQIDVAVRNVESALKDLSDRLDDALPGTARSRRNRLHRAEAAIRRTAHNVAGRLPTERGASLLEDAGQTVRAHPLTVALTAAAAGCLVWSLLHLAGNSRPRTRRERLYGLAERGRQKASEAMQEGFNLRH